MMKRPYACPECRGTGRVECCECGSAVSCEACDGSGINPSKVDTNAFAAAERPLVDAGGTCSLVEDGVFVGRRSLSEKTVETKLYYRDFPFRKEVAAP